MQTKITLIVGNPVDAEAFEAEYPALYLADNAPCRKLSPLRRQASSSGRWEA
jgi:hypothetical protein